jgi:2-oxoglutarate ferredoxin oxidoreductase subunit gamma
MQQIRLCGLGGQGIVMAGAILAQAAFYDNKSVSLSSGYGSQVRGGMTRSDLIFSETFIDFPMVTEIDLLIVMLQEALPESLPLLKGNGRVVVDDSLVKIDPASRAKYLGIPATEMAIRELKSEMVANIVLLAAANAVGQLVAENSMQKAIRTLVSPAFVELNLKAMQLGLKQVEKGRKN